MPRRLGVLIVIVFLMVGCTADGSGQGPGNAEIVYGLTLVPSGIDPHIHASSELGIPLRSVYDSLVYRDPETLDFVPWLARSWQVSADGRVYTFLLRDDVIFHDGTPLNADAVRINLERVLNPDTGSIKAADLLGPVERVEVHEEYSLSIVLAEPYPALLDALSQPYLGIASPATLAEYDSLTYQFHQVGTGPYRFVEYLVNDRLVLERNSVYAWHPEGVPTNDNPVQQITFRFFTDPPARALALESGEADVMGELLPLDARALSEDGTISLLPVAVPGQPLQLIANTGRYPTNDPGFRRALLYGMDRTAIVRAVYQGYANVAFGPITSSTQYYNRALDGMYTFDPVQGDALLNAAGFTDSDGSGWRDIDGEDVELVVVYPPWNLMPEVAELVEQNLESNLDIKIRLEQVANFPMLVEAANTGEYHLIGLNFAGLDPVILNQFFLSDGARNWSRYSSPELDDLLLRAQVTTDSNQRASLYADIQRIIMDQALVIPIQEPVNLNGSTPDVTNLAYDAQGWFPVLETLQVNQPDDR